MATITITKVSGIIFIKESTHTNPKSYFGATGRWQATDASANDTVLLKIGTSGQQQMDEYLLTLGNVTIGTSTPSTMSSLLILLNAIFGN